ncbi:MAG: cytochrome c [Comamonas sp.]
MLDALDPNWVNHLLVFLRTVEVGLLSLLHAVGLAGDLHGQPAWPWGSRIDVEVITIDRGHAREVAWSVLALAGIALCALAGVLLRRRRWGRRVAWGLALALLLAAPWPSPALLLAPAYPTTFQVSPTGYTAQSIAHGRQLYAQHCLACHGADAGGEGPQAASLPMWPPNLNGALLWRRTDGDLLWRVLHGMRDRHGQETMPGFVGQLDAGEVWQILDFLQANAAGQSLRRSGEWPQPVALPDAVVRCDPAAGPRQTTLRALHGQRLRVLAGDGSPVLEDPRFVTVELTRGRPGQGQCQAGDEAEGEAAWQAFALIAGVAPQALAGTQFIVDRDGWVRARAVPGQAGWSAADLLCRSGEGGDAGNAGDAARSANPAPADGLDALIRTMDRQRVQLVKGGVPH